jgi:cell division transport system permease protein
MVLAVVGGLTLVLIALVLVAAVRVQAESRREETAVLQLAGARSSFIVRPYAYAGAMTLGLGAALALAIAAGGTMIVERRVAALAATFGQDFRVAMPPAWLPAAIVLSAAALGLAAAAIAARAAVAGARDSK